jgi:hypothetical protein
MNQSKPHNVTMCPLSKKIQTFRVAITNNQVSIKSILQNSLTNQTPTNFNKNGTESPLSNFGGFDTRPTKLAGWI